MSPIPEKLLREIFSDGRRSQEDLEEFADRACEEASLIGARLHEQAQALTLRLSRSSSDDARLQVLVEDAFPAEQRVAAAASLGRTLRSLRNHGVTGAVTYLPDLTLVLPQTATQKVAVLVTQELLVMLPSGRAKEFTTYPAGAAKVDGVYLANKNFAMTDVTLTAERRLRLAFDADKVKLIDRLVAGLQAVQMLRGAALPDQALAGARPAPRLIRSPADAEAAAANWLRYFGFGGVSLTGAGADAGVDVTADRAVAQVKMEALPTGRPVVQQIHGCAALEGKTAVVFSLAGYTAEAVSWADRAQIPLFRFDFQGEPEPFNTAARTLASQGVSAAD